MPSLNVAQNLLSTFLGMANNNDGAGDDHDDNHDDDDDEVVAEVKDESVMEVRNISTGPEGVESEFFLYNTIRRLLTL